jgi:hypothetical protein
MRYAVESAEPWHREHLTRLYGHWNDCNTLYFQQRLAVPYLLFGNPGSPRVFGTCSNYSGWGGKLAITLRYHLVDGNDKTLRKGQQYAGGRAKFLADVLLHEMVHQWHFEITGTFEDSYKGHGPKFAAECNRIGVSLGLPEVRPAKARGKRKSMPSCASWPHNVRPAGYYEGAFIKDDSIEPEQEPEPEPGPRRVLYLDEWAHLLLAVASYDAPLEVIAPLRKLAEAAGEPLPTIEELLCTEVEEHEPGIVDFLATEIGWLK